MEQKKKLFLSNELKSHPDKLLKVHLKNVGDLCRQILSNKRINLEKFIDFEILVDISYLIGIAHDFGKATKYFQKYIKEEDEKKKNLLKNRRETHHGLISAIFTYFLVKEYLLNYKKIINVKYYKYIPIISFFVVRHHHGNLRNMYDEFDSFDEKTQIILQNQIESIDFGEIEDMYNEILNFKFSWSKFREKFERKYAQKEYVRKIDGPGFEVIIKQNLNLIRDLKEEKKLITSFTEKRFSLLFYFFILFLYSVLLDADKLDASNLNKIQRKYIPPNVIDDYIKKKLGNHDVEINKIRKTIYEETITNIKNVDLEKDKILSINVPTGTGKTLTSLSFALKLRHRIEKEKGYSPQIIYTLPFLSIVDQNYDVFNNVLETINNSEPSTDLLLKHHHLSDVFYSYSGNEYSETDIDKALFLIEGWNSEIIVTTFMQFFYSMFNNKNRAIRKFHNIVNGIIILDEVQAIDHKYWKLLKETINFISEYFNSYFIFVTATQPLIFNEQKGEIKSLVFQKRKFYFNLNRVSLKINIDPIKLDEFKEILSKDIFDNSNKDFLVVLNTIKTSLDIYDFVKKLKLKATELYYLSTNIIPKERLRRIKEIKNHSNKRKIIISTQLVEAGVDIDLDIVYRDFAPLDSINQVAGRCNRNFLQKQGIVKVFLLKDDDGRFYSQRIYGSFLISVTKEILKDAKNIDESGLFEFSEKYFEKIAELKSDDASNELIETIRSLKFSELFKFKLIEEEFFKIDVFVEHDDDAKLVWHKYQEIMKDSNKSHLERKSEFLKLKKSFYEYIISIPKKFVNDLSDFNEVQGLGYISKENLDRYYDIETGFIREKSGTLIC